MSKRKFILLASLSVCAFVAETAQADISSSMHYIFKDVTLFNTLHTHLSLNGALSPQQVSKNQKSLVKVAQVCWIMDTGDCAGLDFVSSDIGNHGGAGGADDNTEEFDKKGPEDCIKEGYTITNCPEGYEGDKACLYADGYYAACKVACPSGYKKCEDPYYGVGEACDGMYASCTCDSCDGYSYSKDNVPDGYVVDGEPCNSCTGLKYKVKPNPCTGYLSCGSTGGQAGASACLSGTNMMYSSCRPCEYKGTLDSCPVGAVCSFEECSSKWYVTGCKSGYTDYCGYCDVYY